MAPSPGAELLSQLSGAIWDRLVEGVSHSRPPRPYMKRKEVAVIEEILANLRPGRCLEWGSGYSTLWFPRRLDKNASWLAVEHEKEWAGKVSGMNRDPRVTVAHVAPNRTPWSDAHNDGAPGDLRDYIDHPSRFGRYDFILVDGRARAACLEKATGLVSQGGVIVLHDANRGHYREALPHCTDEALFTDWRNDEGGLWIGRNGAVLAVVLDVGGHKAIWRAHEVVGNFPVDWI